MSLLWKWLFSQSEKLLKTRKGGTKHYKHIIEDPELRNVQNEKCRKQYAADKKIKGKKPLKVIKAQRLRWRTQKQIQ